MENAYTQHFGYEVHERGEVGSELAELWDAPAMLGRKFLLMQPESQAAVFLRFVEGSEVDGYAPLRTYGWNATEILVQEPDQLAAELADSPFEIIGQPHDLYPTPGAPRAMQVIGPENELLYLTRISPGGTAFPLGSAQSYVDRVFIVVVGGPSMSALQAFYGGVLGAPTTDPQPFRITVLSRANGLDPETATFPLSVAQMPRNFLVELDEYPDMTGPRPFTDGEIPPGMSVVSFEFESLDMPGIDWHTVPRPIAAEPYNGRRAGLVVGPAGEWLELIESRSGD